MYTTTAKTVLTPLADAVSQLILIISTSEIEHAPLQDLTLLAKVVNEQIEHLVQVGTKISNQENADVALKQSMPVACYEVKNASMLLISGSNDLIIDPVSSEGKAKLLRASSGILSGTTAVLNAFDDFEVRKIVNASIAVQQKSTLVRQDVTLVDPNTLIALVKSLQQLIASLAQLTTKRAGDLLSVSHQNRLKQAVATIVRESPVLVGTLKIIVLNRKSRAGLKAKELACLRVENACDEISKVVLMRGDAISTGLSLLSNNTFSIYMKALEEMKNRVLNSVNREDVDFKGLQLSAQNYKHQSRIIIQIAEDMINTMSASRDVAGKQQLNKKLATITAHVERANETQILLLKSPLEHDSQSTTINVLSSASRAIRQFHDEIDNELLADFMDSLNALSDSHATYTSFGRIIRLAESGNITEIDCERFLKVCGGFVGLVGLMADRIAAENENTASEVVLRKNKLAALLPGLISAMEARCADTNDVGGKDLLATMVQMWENDVKDVQNVVFGSFDGLVIVVGTELAASRLLKKLEHLESSDEANEALLNLTKLKGQYATYLGREIENTSDSAYKQVLQDNMQSLEDTIPMHLAEIQRIINGDEFDPSLLTIAVRGLTDVLSTIGASLRRPGQEAVMSTTQLPPLPCSLSLEIEKLSLKQGVVTESNEEILGSPLSLQLFKSIDALEPIYEMPMPFTSEEQLAAPIAAAARDIIVESSRWIEKGNKFIAGVNAVAQKMTLLSHYHNELKTSSSAANKSGFITASHDIINEVNSLVKHARELALKCTDTRLRKQLFNTLEQITSIGSQLKIVASVKAASPKDTDKDQQLIMCAQNLVKAVKMCIVECEVCSIRQGSAEVVDNEAEEADKKKITFQRTIYKKTPAHRLA